MKDAGGHGSNGRGSLSAEDRLTMKEHAMRAAGTPGLITRQRTMTPAARENVNIGKMIDETHYPSRTPGDRDAMKSLAQAGGPKAAPVPVHGGMNTRTGVNGFGFRVGLGTNFMRG